VGFEVGDQRAGGLADGVMETGVRLEQPVDFEEAVIVGDSRRIDQYSQMQKP